MYEYKKPWYKFGIIKRIYYSKSYVVEFTNGSKKYLYECKIDDFYYNSDRTAYVNAKNSPINESIVVVYEN